MTNRETLKKKQYIAVGLMSGTSLDGLDIALCRFTTAGTGWTMDIIKTRTISYNGTQWISRLSAADRLSGLELTALHRDFGRYSGESVKSFLKGTGILPDLIASHGHTVFHQPGKGLTLQVGEGAEIAAITRITTVSDFRRLDVALGGQGAPLVPAGDELLFGQYTHCLNLGGFANISFREKNQRIAFDVCPVNIVLNRLAADLRYSFDNNGALAATGKIQKELLRQLEDLAYYRLSGPRSLGKEWVDELFMHLLNNSGASTPDKLRTVCEHIALRISAAVSPLKSRQVGGSSGSGPMGPVSLLITGGGAKNGFLIRLISDKAHHANITIPGDELVDFKEAVIFAFLGVLRVRNEVNCLSSVTGARKDNSGGIIHVP
jgi:anhydro-N-acetylmuramic acid kinase